MITPTKAAEAVTDLDIVRSALEAEYEVLRELGRGGMAVVYRARERALDREVAIKVLPFTLAFDQSLVERFTREARTAASLEHPHIIPIHRVGQAGQVTYFVMKLLRGQSLSDHLLEKGPLSVQQTRRVLAETASALAYAHERGVVHRDIKPDNILLDESGRCMVTDFGIARSASESRLTASGTSVGTPRYMSPEQARAKDVDGRSDIYSLGIVGYECLTGRPPFDGKDMMAVLLAHINEPVPRPALASPDAVALYAIIERMLAKDPDQRFRRAQDVVDALMGDVATQRAVPAHIPGHRAAAVAGAMARAGGSIRRVGSMLGGRLAVARSYAARHPRRAWGTLAAALVAGVGVPTTAHFTLNHRSRCPVVESAAASSMTRGLTTAAATAGATAPGAAFTVLVDEMGSLRGDAEVYYDVCGLPEGAGYTTRISITKKESGLKRLLGKTVEPMTARFEERADGPAIRHHRTMDMDGKPPGNYWLAVIVTDDRGRRRETGTSFQVPGE